MTLWTPYPVRQPAGLGQTFPGPAAPATGDAPPYAPPDEPPDGPSMEPPDGLGPQVTDEMLHALLTSPAPARRRRRPQALIPLFHGIGAITTFLLAVLTAVGTL